MTFKGLRLTIPKVSELLKPGLSVLTYIFRYGKVLKDKGFI